MIWKFIILSDPGFAAFVTIIFIVVIVAMTMINYRKITHGHCGGNCETEKERLLKELEQLRAEQANQKPKQVVVEITDPILIEELRTQYELQNVYNAQIDQLDIKIAELDTKITEQNKVLTDKEKELNILLSQCNSKAQADIHRKMFDNDIHMLKQAKNKMISEQLRLQEQRLGKVMKSNAITKKVEEIGIRQYKKIQKNGGK